MKYDILLFDADNTLFDFDACERMAFEAMLNAAGIDGTAGMIETYSAINLSCWKRLEKKELTRKELRSLRFELFLRHYGIAYDPKKLAALYEECLSRCAVTIDGAEELLSFLYDRARVYVVTNGLTEVQRGRLSRSPLKRFVLDLFISEEMGADKPDPRFFEGVARRIPDFDRSRALVIGDSLSSDVRGAVNAGLPCVWFDRTGEELPEDLNIEARVTDYRELRAFLLDPDAFCSSHTEKEKGTV